tara:strand:+ start:1285 stop:1926 length:642 start_codon:yes stop_codon:yes gene_type:complete
MDKTAISFDSVCKKFNNRYIIENLNFSFQKGETALLKGKNGIGKTTFFRLASGIIKGQKGNIEIMGGSPNKNKIRSLVNYMGPNDSFYEHLSAFENLVFFSKVFEGKIHRSIDFVLEEVDLFNKKDVPVKNYSTGMKKRLALAISMMHDSELYLFDEPFKGLDDVGKGILKKYLEKIRNVKKTIFLISNFLEEVEGFDSVYEMKDSSSIKKIK